MALAVSPWVFPLLVQHKNAIPRPSVAAMGSPVGGGKIRVALDTVRVGMYRFEGESHAAVFSDRGVRHVHPYLRQIGRRIKRKADSALEHAIPGESDSHAESCCVVYIGPHLNPVLPLPGINHHPDGAAFLEPLILF